jgi:hypothetical protein
MSDSLDLKTLKQHQQDLLLAEVAALLHDMGKCADEHIINQASDKPSDYSYEYKTAQSHRLPTSLPPIRLLGDTVAVRDLIEKGMPRIISDSSQPWPLRVLGKCHAVAHIEKELKDRETSTKQPKDGTCLSSAFGVEGNSVKDLTSLLSGLPFASMLNRDEFVLHVIKAFDRALGDTRRPVNEVTLADWSGAVAALYKSSLAGALLGVKPDPDALRWRLLRVNFDVLGLYAKAIKIADLLGYQRAVEEACKKAKQLVEEEYPLGNEVFRDTTGIYFTFPDLDLPDELGQEIRRRVEEVEPELAPRIDVTSGEGSGATEQLKGLLAKARKEAREALTYPFDTTHVATWQRAWNEEQGTREVCPVCRLRPKEENDEACEHCTMRRAARLQAWKKDPRCTIWLGEIADHNDRVALLVGKFGLADWLSGDLVQTILVKAVANAPEQSVPKNPSPARLRRVWETCQRFWTGTVEQEILARHGYGQKADHAGLRRARYLLTPDRQNDWLEDMPYNGTIEIEANGKVVKRPISLLWRQASKDFVTISNLQQAEEIKAGQIIEVSGADAPRVSLERFKVQSARPAEGNLSEYDPYLPLLASPDQFLAFVPAADALTIAEKICEEYTRQFSKVQNRLPLFLGLVFFERKMPLMAVLDAACQMLTAPLQSEPWVVVADVINDRVRFANGLEWTVPTKMGDQKTDDIWYPYFFIKDFADGTPDRRPYRFQYKEDWLVLVTNLKKGDVVCLTPARFDYLLLDTTARRFEIHYNDQGRRPRRTRPFYLEDLDRLETLWDCLKQLTRTQFKHILQTIETTRELWFGPEEQDQSTSDAVFKRFVDDTLANAAWPISAPWKDLPQEQKEQIIAAGVRGELADLDELHLQILKEEMQGETS